MNQALTLDPKSPYLHCELAAALIASGHDAAASRQLDKALTVDPKFPYALQLRADCLQRAGEQKAAERTYRHCIDLAPERSQCYVRYADLLEQSNRFETAGAVLRKLLRRSDGRHGREKLALICLQQLALDCAAKQFRLLARSFPQSEIALTRSRIERARGRPSSAVALLESAKRAAQGSDNQIDLELLRALSQLDADDALAKLARQVARTTSPARAGQATVVRLLLSLGRYALAAELSRTEGDAPPELQLIHARALDLSGHHEQASRIVRKLRSTSTTAKATLELANLLAEQNRVAEAVNLLETLVQHQPSHESAIVELAQLLVRAGSAARAASVLRRSLDRLPKSSRLQLVLASTLDRLDRWQEAVQIARHVAETEPNNAAAHNAVGYLLSSHGEQLDQAEAAIRTAMRLEPLAPYIIDSLGWLFRARGQTEQARRVLEIAVRLDGQDPELLAHLALLHSDMGNIAMAIKLYRQALSLVHDQALLSRWRRQLEHLEATRVGSATPH